MSLYIYMWSSCKLTGVPTSPMVQIAVAVRMRVRFWMHSAEGIHGCNMLQQH